MVTPEKSPEENKKFSDELKDIFGNKGKTGVICVVSTIMFCFLALAFIFLI